MQNLPNWMIAQGITDEEYFRFRTIEVSKGRLYALKQLPLNGGDKKYIYTSVNAKIKKLRVDNGLTQTELANVLKLSQREYWRYEKEKYAVNFFKISQIAVFYNVSLDWLSGFNPEQKPFYSDVEKTRVNGYSLVEMKEAKEKGEQYVPVRTDDDEITQKKLEYK